MPGRFKASAVVVAVGVAGVAIATGPVVAVGVGNAEDAPPGLDVQPARVAATRAMIIGVIVVVVLGCMAASPVLSGAVH